MSIRLTPDRYIESFPIHHFSTDMNILWIQAWISSGKISLGSWCFMPCMCVGVQHIHLELGSGLGTGQGVQYLWWGIISILRTSSFTESSQVNPHIESQHLLYFWLIIILDKWPSEIVWTISTLNNCQLVIQWIIFLDLPLYSDTENTCKNYLE